MKYKAVKLRRDPSVVVLRKILKNVAIQTRIMEARDLRQKRRAAKEHKAYMKTLRLQQTSSRAHIRACKPAKAKRK